VLTRRHWNQIHSIIKFPVLSSQKLLPGGTTVVALYSVTIAGPEYFRPTFIVSRVWIAVASFFPAK
jgi:hypothetical protein